MGVQYELVNFSKSEKITFAHLNGNKKHELAGNPAQSSIVTWYLLNNQGCDIQFVSDSYDDWPFPSGNRSDLESYRDVTLPIIDELIAHNILKDNGVLFEDEHEPDKVFIKDIVNVWSR